VQFLYQGDGELNRIVAWFKGHLHSIATCVNNDLPEACLTLIYSGIDTLGLLAARPGVTDACRNTFKEWCEAYLLPRLRSVEGEPISAADLYGARCGFLHTSTPASLLSREGNAREFWYRFNHKDGVKLIGSVPRPGLGIDIFQLALALKEGGLAFIADLNGDPARLQVAHDRAQHFLRWGKVELDSFPPETR
jgi:hypothetical protein